MAPPRRFDHDEARALFAQGVRVSELARRYGVAAVSIGRVVGTARNTSLEYHRNHRLRCRGGCGHLVWVTTRRDATGLCSSCLAELRPIPRHGTESRYSAGCRCDDCREAARVAKAARRERRKVACTSCGKPHLHPNDGRSGSHDYTGLCLDCYRASLSPSKEKGSFAA